MQLWMYCGVEWNVCICILVGSWWFHLIPDTNVWSFLGVTVGSHMCQWFYAEVWQCPQSLCHRGGRGLDPFAGGSLQSKIRGTVCPKACAKSTDVCLIISHQIVLDSTCFTLLHTLKLFAEVFAESMSLDPDAAFVSAGNTAWPCAQAR